MLFETFVNVLLSFEPRVVIAEIAATAIRAAIRPYSIAVAPLLFFRNLRIWNSLSRQTVTLPGFPPVGFGKSINSGRGVAKCLIPDRTIRESLVNAIGRIGNLGLDMVVHVDSNVGDAAQRRDHGDDDQRDDQAIFDGSAPSAASCQIANAPHARSP